MYPLFLETTPHCSQMLRWNLHSDLSVLRGFSLLYFYFFDSGSWWVWQCSFQPGLLKGWERNSLGFSSIRFNRTGAFSFGEQVTQSIPEGNSRVPLVSIQTYFPMRCNASTNASSTHNPGSPPVRITVRQGYFCTAARISSSDISTPVSWRVSQNPQRRLHPEKRTNTAGIPVWKPSPWRL